MPGLLVAPSSLICLVILSELEIREINKYYSRIKGSEPFWANSIIKTLLLPSGMFLVSFEHCFDLFYLTSLIMTFDPKMSCLESVTSIDLYSAIYTRDPKRNFWPFGTIGGMAKKLKLIYATYFNSDEMQSNFWCQCFLFTEFRSFSFCHHSHIWYISAVVDHQELS